MYSKDLNYVWFDTKTPHYLYLGSSGSGKTVTAVIPMCSFIATAKTSRSLFITDPKGEIYAATSKMFADNGYKVFTIDFRNPSLSNRINLLQSLIKAHDAHIEAEAKAEDIAAKLEQPYAEDEEKKLKKSEIIFRNDSISHLAETNKLITAAAEMLTTEKGTSGDSKFWNSSASNLLQGLIGLFLEDFKAGKIPKEKITLTSIKKFQNSFMEEDNFDTLVEYLQTKAYGMKSKDSLTSILGASENTFKSICSVFSERMALFDNITVANITSESDFDLDVLGKEKSVLYVIIPDEDKTYYGIVTLLVGLIYKELVKLANLQDNKRLPIGIDFLLDEFCNCPPINDIESIVSVSRSRNMRFHFFIQSFSQLDQVYGKDVAQIIRDNAGLIYLKTNTMQTAQEISTMLGKKTLTSQSVSESMGTLAYNGNLSTSLMGRELLTPDEVHKLVYKTIIFPTVGYPIFRDTVLYDKLLCYRKGTLKRESRPLLDLSHTYYTANQINDINAENMLPEVNRLLEEKKVHDTAILMKSMKVINETLDDVKNISYEIKNTETAYFLKIIIPYIINGDDHDRLEADIDNNIYHKIFNFIDNKTNIEIYLKNI